MFPIFAGSNPSGYNLTRSLRFRASASGYLNRTFTTPTSSTKFTWSGWVKRGKLDASNLQGIFCPYSSGTVYGYLAWYQDGLRIFDRLSSGTNYLLQTTAVYRDPSSWYHIVYAVDTTQATAANRIRLYVNGVEITAFSTATYPTQNNSTTTNSAIAHNIGYDPSNTAYLDGYLAENNFIDGQQLTPTSFGSTNALTGVWQPARYTGTYGTNGFYLPFTDNSGATSTTIGKDFSGNSNNWTPNNISVTAGVTYDSMTDVPTLTSATAANFAVMNPLDKHTNVTLSNGNLDATFNAFTGFVRASFALPSTGKWYWEGTVPTTDVRAEFGIATFSQALGVDPQGASGCWFLYSNGTNTFKFNGSGTSWGTAWVSGDIIGIAFDATAGTLTFYKNNTLQGGGAAFTGLTGTYAPMVGFGNNTSTAISTNFGQRPFSYTPPTGFVALNTYNLPTSTIVKGNTVMDATLYTGNGSTQTITNAAGFKPDLVWAKTRVAVSYNALFDSVRGVSKALYSNTTASDDNIAPYGVTAFNSNGFAVNDTSAGLYAVNGGSGGTYSGTPPNYVAWQWQAGQGSSSSNTNGTITSTVSVNASAGFSVVTYTGTGVAATIGHGLGVAPQWIVVKNRNGTVTWRVYHASLANTQVLYLSATDAATTETTTWNSTTPTSSVFSVGTGSGANGNTNTYVAYCWTPIAGFSAFGSYTGNGSADGPFVYTGFRPKFVLIKRTDGVGNWSIYDTARDTYNAMTQVLNPNLSDAEANNTATVDYLSNGFKLRIATFQPNTSGATFVYAAFAENPFKNSLAR